MQTESIDIQVIEIGSDRRPLDMDAVERLAESIDNIGLRTPITVLDINEGQSLRLVAGRHRVEACKRLGMDKIDAFVMEGDSVEAEMWEIAENLHRADLTKEQRDENIRRYAELLAEREAGEIQAGQVDRPEIGYKKPPPQKKGIASKIAEETGLSQRTIRRALNPQPTADPKPPLSDEYVRQQQVNALMSAWNRASPEARAEFMELIDVPVMDRSAA